jgi:hypothetical protein
MLSRKEELTAPVCCESCQSKPAVHAGQSWDVAAGICSIGIWTLVPKCPLCLAAYLTLWTGLGLSLTQAMYVRWSLLGISGLILGYVLWNRIGRRLMSN